MFFMKFFWPPGHKVRRVEHAEAKARFEEAPHRAIHVVDGKQAVLEGKIEGFKLGTAREVGASLDGQRSGLTERKYEVVGLVEVADGPAVGDHVTAESPLPAKQVEEPLVGASGLPQNRVVRAHDGVGVAVDNGGAEGRRVRIVEIVEGDRNIEAVAEDLGAGVHGVMFGRADGFQIVWVVALQAGNESKGKMAGEERVFAVGFLPTAPARIAEDVDVGRPEGETVIAAGVVVGDGVVVFGARFGGNDVGDGVDEIGVPGGAEADGLRKDSGVTGAGDTVESFVPPVVRGDLQTRDGGSDVLHLGDFLLEGHARDEVVDPLLDGIRGVEVDRRR